MYDVIHTYDVRGRREKGEILTFVEKNQGGCTQGKGRIMDIKNVD